MKRSLKQVIYTLPMFILTFTSCNNDKADNTMAFSTFSASSTFELKGSAEEFGNKENLLVTDSVSLIIPTEMLGGVNAEVLRDSILSMAIDSVHVKDVQAAITGYACDSTMWSDLGYKLKKVDKNVPVNQSNGFTLVNGDIDYLSNRLMVYRIFNESYFPGAAHGMYSLRYLNYYQPNGGKILTLNDLFTPEGLRKLPARINAAAKENYYDALIEALPDGGNFFISTNNDIVFVYQPYEVACYATGIVKVSFNASELLDWLTPFGKKVLNVDYTFE